jgi:hypothetical protein
MKPVLILMLTAFFLVGCDQSDQKNKEAGSLGVVEDKSKSLTGLDANADGVRDDVEEFIAKEAGQDVVMDALLRDAHKIYVRMMTATKTDSYRQAMEDLSLVSSCIYATYPNYKTRDRVNNSKIKTEALTANTLPRLKAYLKNGEAAGTWAISLGAGMRCTANTGLAKMPRLTVEELIGEDTNKNYIRDDVDTLINSSDLTEQQRKTVVQFARSIGVMTLAKTHDQSLQTQLSHQKGKWCMGFVFGVSEGRAEEAQRRFFDEIKTKLYSEILNTAEREAAFALAAYLAGGESDLGFTPEVCE